MLFMKRFVLILICAWTFTAGRVSAQVTPDSLEAQQRALVEIPIIRPGFVRIDEDSALKIIDRQPSFGLFRDNYFLTGIPLNRKINGDNADVKFQLSIRQRITQSILPFKTFLYLTVTQKTYWNLYQKSAPFRDMNLNPSISVGKILIRNNELKGVAALSLEHESNGRDSLANRSWNMVSLSASFFFNPRFKIEGKLWAPFWIAPENSDIVDRRGIGYVELHYRSADERLWLSLQMNPRRKFGRINTVFEMHYKVGPKANQYWFLQYYNGYGESLMDYDRYVSMLRVGFSIKANFMSVF